MSCSILSSVTGCLLGLGSGLELLHQAAPHCLERVTVRSESVLIGPIHPSVAFSSDLDEGCLAQHPQMLRDGAEGEVEMLHDLAGGWRW
jgi:hypothetical protein